MNRYILMPAAKADLAEIRDYYLEEAGYRVARQTVVEFVEAFRFLARTPGAGHVRIRLKFSPSFAAVPA